MQVVFGADFSHDEPKEHIVIVSAYPKGTEPRFAGSPVAIPPHTLIKGQRMTMLVTPVIGEKGKDWHGRIVLVDQHERKYKTRKVFLQVGWTVASGATAFDSEGAQKWAQAQTAQAGQAN